MQVSNVSIIKTNSINSAIESSIIEFYNEKHAKMLNERLDVSGVIGTCIYTDELSYGTRTTTAYFIVTLIAGGFYRVEHCSEVSNYYNY